MAIIAPVGQRSQGRFARNERSETRNRAIGGLWGALFRVLGKTGQGEFATVALAGHGMPCPYEKNDEETLTQGCAPRAAFLRAFAARSKIREPVTVLEGRRFWQNSGSEFGRSPIFRT